MFRILLLCVVSALSLGLPAAPQAQPADEGSAPFYVEGAPAAVASPMRFTAGAVYQQYDDDDVDLAVLSVPFTTSFSLTRALSLGVRASFVSADGADQASYFGYADTQAALSFQQTFGGTSAVASLSVNLPTGVEGATPQEAETAFLIGQAFYGFRLPTLGQGYNVAPGLTIAFPVSSGLAVGVGASYQYRGPFEPSRLSDAEYDPGDEVLLSAGFDARLGAASTVALDATYVAYSEDTFEGFAYTTGDAFMVTAQWTAGLGGHDVQLLGRARVRGETSIPPETLALLGPDATVPTQGRLLGHARFRFGDRLRFGVRAQGRYYEESEVFSAKTLFDVGVVPEVQVAPGLWLNGRVGGTVGDLQGFDVGAGLAWGL